MPMQYALVNVHQARVSKPMDVLDRIRAGCRSVAENARHVRIEVGRIPEYARSLSLRIGAPPRLDTTVHYLDDEAATVAYFVTLDAVNFGSGYFPHLRKRPGASGYYTIAASLTDRFRARGPIPPAELVRITPQDCSSLFGQDKKNPPIRELMSLFAHAWNDLGRTVVEQHDGSFIQLVRTADHSARRLVELLSAQPFFRDETSYDGEQVLFYKRAQLLASDLALAFDDAGPGRFEDLDRLTIFADNLVPHVLYIDGILTYTPRLRTRIEEEEPIASGSQEEVEIRACAVDACERVVSSLCKAGQPATPRDLDIVLWNRGQQAEYKNVPRHRTRTVFY
jgi:hypothetical protein